MSALHLTPCFHWMWDEQFCNNLCSDCWTVALETHIFCLLLSLYFCTAPGQVQNLTVTNFSSTYLIAQWSAPGMFNGVPVHYNISLIEKLMTIYSYTVALSSPRYAFSSLTPYSNYTVRVSAESSGGIGTSVDVVQETSPAGMVSLFSPVPSLIVMSGSCTPMQVHTSEPS